MLLFPYRCNFKFLIFYADSRGEGVEVSLNFFPVSRKSDLFFMRLPVGSVVFVSHRLVCEGVLLCKFFRQKIFPDQRKTEQFFSMKPNLQSQKPP